MNQHMETLGCETLSPLAKPDPAHLQALRAQLGAAAQRAGLLDVSYRIIDTRVGPLLLAATARGLVRVAYEREDFRAVLQTLAEKLGPRILPGAAGGLLAQAAQELEQYLDGTRRGFDLRLDWRLVRSAFRRDVLARLRDIAYGTTSSYGRVASQAGRPRAVRAVGTACATNPLPLVLPCHRVLRADGSLGGYIGGPQVKALLLQLEQGRKGAVGAPHPSPSP